MDRGGLPEILDYKAQVMHERPVCALERVALDLANVSGRRGLFEQLGKRATKALIISEGLIIYFTAEEVASLARDLAAPASFGRWILDLASPGLVKMLQKKMPQLRQGGTTLKFGPPEGPEFFVPCGWQPLDVRSFFKTAARLKRLPFLMSLMAWLPESNGAQGSRPWAAA